jgi:hypothetical protein
MIQMLKTYRVRKHDAIKNSNVQSNISSDSENIPCISALEDAYS